LGIVYSHAISVSSWFARAPEAPAAVLAARGASLLILCPATGTPHPVRASTAPQR